MSGVDILYLLKLLWPLLVIDVGMRVYCLTLIFRNGVRNWNKWGWAAVTLIINLGWIVFLIFGRKSD